MDRLQALGAFVAVAEAQGFAAAAGRLSISPSGVTRLVAALEAELGVPLLARTTRRVALTEAGARYLPRARRILGDLAEADAEARAEQARPAGRLVVAAPTSFGRRQVAPLLCDFLATHEGVSGQLLLADRPVNLVEEGVDVAVRIGVLPDSSLTVRPIGATRRVLVASPGYLAARGRPRTPADLEHHAAILFSSLTPHPEWALRVRGRERRVTVRPVFATNSADAAVAFAERGGGVALLLAYQVTASVARGRLVVLLAGTEPAPSPIQLVHAAGRRPPAALRAFIDYTVEHAAWDFTRLERRSRGR